MTEQDCLDKISEMKDYRIDAGKALEEKNAVIDSSATLLADMPALIPNAGIPPYVRATVDFKSVTPNNDQNFTLNIKSNTTWYVVAVSMGPGGAGQTFTGAGDSTITITYSSTLPGSSYFYRVLVKNTVTNERQCVWIQRYNIS